MNIKKIAEKSHRLELNAYTGFARATFTLCINGRKKVLVNAGIAEEFVEILENCCKKHEVVNWIYIFMPDHLHLVLEGISENSNIYKCAVLFKQKTGYYFSKNTVAAGSRKLQLASDTQAEACGYSSLRCYAGWQKDFYDHIHRKDEDLKKHIRYIAENPVRGGLTARWEDYPYIGSVHYNLKVLLNGM